MKCTDFEASLFLILFVDSIGLRILCRPFLYSNLSSKHSLNFAFSCFLIIEGCVGYDTSKGLFGRSIY